MIHFFTNGSWRPRSSTIADRGSPRIGASARVAIRTRAASQHSVSCADRTARADDAFLYQGVHISGPHPSVAARRFKVNLKDKRFWFEDALSMPAMARTRKGVE